MDLSKKRIKIIKNLLDIVYEKNDIEKYQQELKDDENLLIIYKKLLNFFDKQDKKVLIQSII